MRFPQSIRGRLLASALVFTLVALLFAGLSIGAQFDRFARRGLDGRLDAQSELLARSIRPDGRIDREMLQDIARLIGRRGWEWSISTPIESARSGEGRRTRREGGGYSRTLQLETASGPATVNVSAPRGVGDGFRRSAIWPWLVSLAALAGFLFLALLMQLRFGLAPLARLRASLGDVRAGRASRVPQDQPSELREVASELNSLLDESEAALARARGHVANLAHSLKTPLATLSLKLRDGREASDDLLPLVEQIEGNIRHHLGRARAASPGAPGQLTVAIQPAVSALLGLLERIHADRKLAAHAEVDAAQRVKCDPQDLDEMLGNLLDNAFKWARSQVRVSSAERGAAVAVSIEDDGPGLDPQGIERALARGERLDEQGDGHGFGLPIARELAELHGGSLELDRSPLGGLRATLVLPG